MALGSVSKLKTMKYIVTIQVGGQFWEGFKFELCRSRFFFIAWLRAQWHLAVFPYRAVMITKA